MPYLQGSSFQLLTDPCSYLNCDSKQIHFCIGRIRLPTCRPMTHGSSTLSRHVRVEHGYWKADCFLGKSLSLRNSFKNRDGQQLHKEPSWRSEQTCSAEPPSLQPQRATGGPVWSMHPLLTPHPACGVGDQEKWIGNDMRHYDKNGFGFPGSIPAYPV